VKAFNTTFVGTLVEGQVAGQPLDVLIAGDDEEAKERVVQLVRGGGLRAIDVGPLERARELEGLGFLGITLQQPLGLNFQSAWKLIS
jgi:8-hydroxy-5-deazaflavin:NADPH oxidoreductase